MIVMTGVNFASKENIYKETKHSLITCIEDWTDGKARTGLDIKLEPAWREVTYICTRAVHVQPCKIGWMKKKLNLLVVDRNILLCKFMWVLQAS